MDIAIGIGRPIVQDEFWLASPSLVQTPVKIDFAPAGEKLRLLFRQAAAHRKIGPRQKKAL